MSVAISTAVATKLLADNADLPAPARVSTNGAGFEPITYRVSFQMGQPADVAQWAAHHGVRVRVTEKSGYVGVTAILQAQDINVQLWAQMSHRDAYKLLDLHDLEPGRDGIEVDPAVFTTKDGEA